MSTDQPIPPPDVSRERPRSDHWVWAGHHRPAIPMTLVEHMTQQWDIAPIPDDVHPAAAYCAGRRATLGRQFPTQTLVIPTGGFKVRANDTDYRFRPGTDFFYLTGSQEPDVVLVIAPSAAGPRSTLYVAPRRDQRTHEFFTDARYGELWAGPRRGVDEAAVYYDIATAPLDRLEKDLVDLAGTDILCLRGIDSTVDAMLAPHAGDDDLARALGEMRLVKDDYEIAQLDEAVRHTVAGFEDVVRALPRAVERGERVIEGVFHMRARVEGNDVGYDVIAASGSHATILHWMRNDGDVDPDGLLLLDAGVESQQIYTADVTRTMPVNGHFSPAQRLVYDIVLRAQRAGIDAVRPGASFRDPHKAAMRVICEALNELGIVNEDPDDMLRAERQTHRRYTLHGTSHMLGLDVHDCVNSRDDVFFGELREGYVLTVEPGLYFQANDLTVPAELRGIGVRIEDDILVTADGCRNLSAALPRDPDDIEAWMAALWNGPSGDLQY